MGIEALPEEILLEVFNYLDSEPPSILKLRQEPSLELTSSKQHTFKEVSRVTKQWRRLTLPLLFKHTRLFLDHAPLKHWSRCPACTQPALHYRLQVGKRLPCPRPIDQYHLDMLEDFANASTLMDSSAHETMMASLKVNSFALGSRKESAQENYLKWAPRFYHSLRDFLDFLEEQDLLSTVQSFVVLTEKMLPDKLDRFPHVAAANQDWRYKAAAALWQHLFSAINPERVAILAPPIDLACLTNCAIDTFGDWAFGDMEYHVLDLRIHGGTSKPPSSWYGQPVKYDELQYMPHRYPGLAGSSILNVCSWSSISLNEGAFLKAYGTYEYFERGPPSLIYSIKDSFSPRPVFSPHARISNLPLASLRHLTYTGIFPFANHLDFAELLPQLEELDMQLAPELSSNILSHPERVAKAQMEDCWNELISCYKAIAALLATPRINKKNMPRLKKFVCRDSQLPVLLNDLDEVFIFLCLPVWAEYEPGVFTRLAADADGYTTDFDDDEGG